MTTKPNPLCTQIFRSNLTMNLKYQNYLRNKEENKKSVAKSKTSATHGGIANWEPYKFMSGIKTYLDTHEIASPTPIQTMAFNEILHTPNNFYIGAQTGTGKTLAYL